MLFCEDEEWDILPETQRDVFVYLRYLLLREKVCPAPVAQYVTTVLMPQKDVDYPSHNKMWLVAFLLKAFKKMEENKVEMSK